MEVKHTLRALMHPLQGVVGLLSEQAVLLSQAAAHAAAQQNGISNYGMPGSAAAGSQSHMGQWSATQQQGGRRSAGPTGNSNQVHIPPRGV